jgi:FlaA1/EpsC-like NDP-sugar epimerase
MFNKIKTLNVLPRWIIIFIDTIIFAFAALNGYLLRLNFIAEDLFQYNFLRGVVIFTACGIIASLITRSFAGIIRYTGIQDTIRVFYAAMLTLTLSFGINYLSTNALPYSISIIAFFVALVALISYRLIVKELFSFYRTTPKQQKKILIFGAGQSGMVTKQMIGNDLTSNVKVIGFLEDNNRKVGNVLSGVKIFSARDDFEKLVLKHSPTEMILSAQSVSVDRKNELVDKCLEFGIKITTVPTADKWIGGEFDIHQIKQVNIEDLLGRSAIILKNKFVAEEIINKKVLITGAAGSIGSEIVRQVVKYSPASIIMLDQSETGLFEIENEIRGIKSLEDKLVSFVCDITNKPRLELLFKQFSPDIIFHAAAYKHVPMMEANVAEAVSCNALGTMNLAELAIEFKTEKFVMISTDKAVNPTSVMGATKRAAEIYVQSMNQFVHELDNSATKFVTTRFGNVLGSNGSVIPIFKNQIQNGGPITVTHPEITRFFMTIPEACALVLEAGVMGKGGEIFVFDMGNSVKIADMARRMIQLSGLKEGADIDIVYTGLRPGEKLYEELLGEAENTLRTHHPKIQIAEVQPSKFDSVKRVFEDLESIYKDASNRENQMYKLVQVLKDLIPEYISMESQFEALDVKKEKSATN